MSIKTTYRVQMDELCITSNVARYCDGREYYGIRIKQLEGVSDEDIFKLSGLTKEAFGQLLEDGCESFEIDSVMIYEESICLFYDLPSDREDIGLHCDFLDLEPSKELCIELEIKHFGKSPETYEVFWTDCYNDDGDSTLYPCVCWKYDTMMREMTMQKDGYVRIEEGINPSYGCSCWRNY